MSCPRLPVLLIALLATATTAIVRGAENDVDSNSGVAEELNRLAEPFRFGRQVGGKDVPMQLHQPALMSFIDWAREKEHSRLWMWTANGRPAAFLGVSMNSNRRAFEAASVSEEPVVVNYGDVRWDLNATLPVWRPLKADFTPADNPRLRLIQLKRLAERFNVRETQSKDGVHELRLLPTPVYRAPATDTAADAAVFIFAYGTNAEVILCLESAMSDDGFAWRYSLAALTAAEFKVSVDDNEVWTQPKYRFFGPSTRSMYVSKDLPEIRVKPSANPIKSSDR